MLFFVISELAGVEPMYQYSLAWFVKLFEATLQQAEKARDLQKRIDNLITHFQYSLYLKVCVSAGTLLRSVPQQFPDRKRTDGSSSCCAQSVLRLDCSMQPAPQLLPGHGTILCGCALRGIAGVPQPV